MNFLEYFYELNKKLINYPNARVANSCDEFNMNLIASDFLHEKKTIFVITPSLFLAQKYYDTLTNLVSWDDVLFFPEDELVSTDMISSSGDFLFERINTLYTLLSDSKKIIVLNIVGAIKYELPKDIWLNSFIKLEENKDYDIDNLIKNLVSIGYEKVYTITKTGEFSKRGSIIDIFPLGSLEPIRLDFFDNTLETIKNFDVETQRSTNKIKEAFVLPVSEFIFGEEEYNIARNKILSFTSKFELSELEDNMYKKDLENLYLHKSLDTLSRYIKFFSNEEYTIFDFVDNKKIYLIDPVKSKEMYERLMLDIEDSCGRLGGYSLSNLKIFKDFEYITNNASISLEGIRSLFDTNFDLDIKPILPYKAQQKLILQDLIDYRNKHLVLVINDLDRVNKLNELLEEKGLILVKLKDFSRLKSGQIHYIEGGYPSFILNNDLIVINESTIFDVTYTKKTIHYKSIYKNATKISNYDELVIGDYVVHYDYGIGRYEGIKTLTQKGISRDYINIIYAKGSALLLPLEKISDLMKYASKDAEGIVLHELGSTAWARQKARVRKKVHDISDTLIKLYAARQAAEGFQFPEDNALQLELENDFEYELTEDQRKAINDVKRDMESKRPMDRLICGDVGYGKTEVALRAAFKAILGGKQVAVLAPTTILARQHYNTFKKRIEKFGARVELLSRFVSRKDQTKIIEDLKRGSVDLVVGTHRILSDEVKFNDLGLLIVDEEQRFGVTHKEKIKALKVNVDCITLTATPIPRTLQMSVMGIKDLSMIETPPKNRYPIQTYVLERNERIIQDAITREIARGGQVFYLYNRVDSIFDVAKKLNELVPYARIGIGHGKLSKDELEDVISGFINKEYDVLLCTTIIETGIDIPDTNTLIIHDADRLGLAQMYQIRGRVGRSSKIAYAYLMYEPKKLLTPEAEKRLETIKEFNELGSGYKIAMRDLSIRGSGDLLGDEQSGFVESVGIDVYLKILQEEIDAKKHEGDISFNKPEEKKEDVSLITPLVSRTIQKDYINSDDIRIEVHKKIDRINSIAGLHQLEAELIDRFGEINEELYLYMYEKLMKSYCKQVGVYKLDNSKINEIKYIIDKDSSRTKDGNLMFQEAYKLKLIKLSYANFEIQIIQTLRPKQKLDDFKLICEYFSKIL